MNQKPGQSLENVKAQIKALREAIERAQELKRHGGALTESFRVAIERAQEIAKKIARELGET